MESVELSIAFASVLLNWLQKQGHTMVLVRKDAASSVEGAGLICWRRDLETLGSSWMFLNMSLALSLFEVRLSWNAGVTLEASGRELHLLQMQRSCWSILDANVVGNAGLLSVMHQVDLSSRYAPRISAVGRSIKDPGLLTVKSLDCLSLLIRPASKNQKLLSFLKDP